MKKRTIKRGCAYLFLILFGLVMVYPIVWMFFATFKSNAEIFGSLRLLPSRFSMDSYIAGWKGSGRVGYDKFFVNTFKLVLPVVLFTLASCSVVAYGFARFRFPGRRPLFLLLIATLMLPNAVIIIPRYTLFNSFGWLNTYLPFYVPALFACYPFFVFMIVQFFRGLPRELDESAWIDGCSTFQVLWRILLPLMKPALFSAGLFQFLWTWNDYFNSLIFINSVEKYPLSLGLRLSLDLESSVAWSNVLAMALVSILPLIVLFFVAQKYFVEGIATTGLKG